MPGSLSALVTSLSAAARLLALIVGLLIVTFVLVRISGNPIVLALGDKLSDAELQSRIRIAGLDRPWMEQFQSYLLGVLQLDFGDSLVSNLPVIYEISKAAVTTVEIVVPAILFGLPLAFATAFAAVRWLPGKIDWIFRSTLVAIYALPAFIVALAFKLISGSLSLGLPLSGRLSAFDQVKYLALENRTGFVVFDALRSGDSNLLASGIAHLVLPISVLVLVVIVTLSRVFFLKLKEAYASSFTTGARAKGLSESRILFRHSTKFTLPSLFAISGIETAALLTGVIYVENAFELRGLGYLLVQSVMNRDYPVVQAIVLLSGILIVFINALFNWIAKRFDPRIEHAE